MRNLLVLLMLTCIAAGPATQPTSGPALDEKAVAVVQLIQKLQGMAVFGDLHTNGRTVHVIVGPAFNGLSFEAKQNFCNVALAWGKIYEKDADHVSLDDRNDNHLVGTFDGSLGLVLR